MDDKSSDSTSLWLSHQLLLPASRMMLVPDMVFLNHGQRFRICKSNKLLPPQTAFGLEFFFMTIVTLIMIVVNNKILYDFFRHPSSVIVFVM